MEEFSIPFSQIVRKEKLNQISEEEFAFPYIDYAYNMYGALQTITKVYNKKEDKSYYRIYMEQASYTEEGIKPKFESRETPDFLIEYRKSRMSGEEMDFDINAL